MLKCHELGSGQLSSLKLLELKQTLSDGLLTDVDHSSNLVRGPSESMDFG